MLFKPCYGFQIPSLPKAGYCKDWKILKKNFLISKFKFFGIRRILSNIWFGQYLLRLHIMSQNINVFTLTQHFIVIQFLFCFER